MVLMRVMGVGVMGVVLESSGGYGSGGELC